MSSTRAHFSRVARMGQLSRPETRISGLKGRSVAALALACLALALGCGRKATVEDCQQIVKRIVELELKSVVPAQELSSEVRDAQQELEERARADCVGRRITEKSLACVAAANSAEALIDDCFD